MAQAQLVAFYVDRGWSEGMHAAAETAISLNLPIRYRNLEGWTATGEKIDSGDEESS